MTRHVNQLFGKRVIGGTTGEQIATVRDVVLSADSRRIVALVVGGGSLSGERAVRWEAITGVGEYVVVANPEPAPLEDDDEVGELRRGAEKITDKKIISVTGEELGAVGDMVYDERGAIVGFVLKKQGLFGGSRQPVLRVEDVQAIGKDAIIAAHGDLVSPEAIGAQRDAGGADDGAAGPDDPGRQPDVRDLPAP